MNVSGYVTFRWCFLEISWIELKGGLVAADEKESVLGFSMVHLGLLVGFNIRLSFFNLNWANI